MPGTYISPAETGLYYLQSRYYDPQICRFINADSFASTGQGILGHNMFAYCENNPIIFSDDGGETMQTAIAGLLVGGILGAIAAVATGGSLQDALIGAAAGAIAGGIIGLTGDLNAGRTAGRIVGSACAAIGTYATIRINGGDTQAALLCATASFTTTYLTSLIPVGSNVLDQVLVNCTFGFGPTLSVNGIGTALLLNQKNKPQPPHNVEPSTQSQKYQQSVLPQQYIAVHPGGGKTPHIYAVIN